MPMLKVFPERKVWLKKKSHCTLLLLMTKVFMAMTMTLTAGVGVESQPPTD